MYCLVMELCAIKALSFAIGIYLPLSTTLPIFIVARSANIDNKRKKSDEVVAAGRRRLGKGICLHRMVAGGAIAGVVVLF